MDQMRDSESQSSDESLRSSWFSRSFWRRWPKTVYGGAWMVLLASVLVRAALDSGAGYFTLSGLRGAAGRVS